MKCSTQPTHCHTGAELDFVQRWPGTPSIVTSWYEPDDKSSPHIEHFGFVFPPTHITCHAHWGCRNMSWKPPGL